MSRNDNWRKISKKSYQSINRQINQSINQSKEKIGQIIFGFFTASIGTFWAKPILSTRQLTYQSEKWCRWWSPSPSPGAAARAWRWSWCCALWCRRWPGRWRTRPVGWSRCAVACTWPTGASPSSRKPSDCCWCSIFAAGPAHWLGGFCSCMTRDASCRRS